MRACEDDGLRKDQKKTHIFFGLNFGVVSCVFTLSVEFIRLPLVDQNRSRPVPKPRKRNSINYVIMLAGVLYYVFGVCVCVGATRIEPKTMLNSGRMAYGRDAGVAISGTVAWRTFRRRCVLRINTIHNISPEHMRGSRTHVHHICALVRSQACRRIRARELIRNGIQAAAHTHTHPSQPSKQTNKIDHNDLCVCLMLRNMRYMVHVCSQYIVWAVHNICACRGSASVHRAPSCVCALLMFLFFG